MTENTPQPNPANEVRAAKNELDEAIGPFKEYVTPVLTGLVAAAVVVGGWQLYRANKASTESRAAIMLRDAQSVSQLENVSTEYGKTSSGAAAQLAADSIYFSQGQYEQAQRAFSQFKEKYPEHPLRLTAEYGIAQCIEASGFPAEALSAYEGFIKNNPNHYLSPPATLGKGRALSALGQLADARSLYEDFIAASPDSPWVPDADSLLKFVEKDIRAQGGE